MYFTNILKIAVYFLCLTFISIEAQDWSQPNTIGFSVSSASDVAVNDAGNVVSVFTHFDGRSQRVQSAFRSFGKKWITLPQYLSPVGISTNSPKVATSSRSNAVAVWVAASYTSSYVQAAIFDFKERTWSNAINLTGPMDLCAEPVVGMDAQGNSIAAWSIFDGSSFHIQSAILKQGQCYWQYLEEIIVDRAYYLDLAIDFYGNAVLVWEGAAGYKTVIQAATLRNGSTYWIQTDDVSLSNIDSNLPRVGIDKNGNAIVVWAQGWFWATIASAKLPFGSTTWIDINSNISQNNSNFADIAVDPMGNAVVVWVTFVDSDQVRMEAALMRAGSSTWSDPTILTQSSQVIDPEVVVDQYGNAIAICATAEGIQAFLLPFGKSWSVPQTITPSTVTAGGQRIAMSRCSFAVVTYTQQFPSSDNEVVQAIHSKKIFQLFSDLHLKGKSIKYYCNGFLRFTNRLKWEPSKDNCVAYYLLRRDGKVIAKISREGPFRYDDSVFYRDSKHTYTVTVVKSNGAVQTSCEVVIK